ncbi:fasciclin domain-containing protein [Faecalibacter bovis]|uniref:Fasciclin domain-containing protein n=1 Tax=Faecalibacter bovis TaxID=2898187 RepID=A0ABX7XC74_9FLAO|nr:fasciclin domain-containing protein [Faecalibacter bovis]QTV05516.1 fasciclin domain-containing protein [Faecalibacter bovis]
MKLKSMVKSMTKVGLGLVMAGSVLVSCNDDDDNQGIAPNDQTIAGIVTSNSSFSTLSQAVTKAGLGATLSGNGEFTVFAPNNAAFEASGITSATLATLTTDQTKDILLYHTLASKVASSAVPAGPNAKVTTAQGDPIYVTKDARGVFVNGWKVNQADIMASNGIIHSIERVLLPAPGNLVETAQGNENLTYLVAAVVRASQGNTNVANVLASTEGLTVFAPTNQAFINAGFPTIASIQAADPDVLTSILTYHVVGARAFSSDLTNNQALNTVQGGTLLVNIGNQVTIKGRTNSTASTVIAPNVLATNGVVHVIDQVLLP